MKVTLVFQDDGSVTWEEVDGEVTPPPPPPPPPVSSATITSTAHPIALHNQPFSHNLRASVPVTSWSVAASAAGFTIVGDRLIHPGLGSGTPASAQVTANLASGETATQSITPVVRAVPTEKNVIVYYPGWEATNRPASGIDYASLTHIHLFSVIPTTSGALNRDFFIDGTNGPLWAKDVCTRAHAAGKKCIVEIGGGGYHDLLLGTATDATKRATFVTQLYAFVDELGADGVALDWEPLWTSDFPAVLALVREMRNQRPSMYIGSSLGAHVNQNSPFTESPEGNGLYST